MGVVLKDQGKLMEAIEAYNKAIALNPMTIFEAYNNIASTFEQHGKIEEALEANKKAISIKPDYADAYWNLSGKGAQNTSEAKKSLVNCLVADPNHLKAKLTLSALHFYEGNKSDFNSLMQSPLKDDPHMRSFAWTFSLLNYLNCILHDGHYLIM